MKVSLFGQLKELAAAGVLDLPQVRDSRELRTLLEEKLPMLKSLPFLLAVDRKIASEDTSLEPGQEIAILPPYSGG